MQDSYGDGWNGAQLEVLLNDVPIGIFSATAASSTAAFTACDGDAIKLIYTAGQAEYENTYFLYGPYGAELFANGPTPSTGEVFNMMSTCPLTPVPGSLPCVALPIDTLDCIIADNTAMPGSGIGAGCANYTGGDLWFALPIPPSGNVVVNTTSTGGLNDTGIALWSGPDCFSLTRHACDDDGGPDYFSSAFAFDLDPQDTLYIQAFGYGGATGTFQLCANDVPTVTLENSELPIVLINTLGQTVPQMGKVDALMEMKYNGPGQLTNLSDPSNVYNGSIGLGIRGATSSSFPQRPYSLETRDSVGANNNVPLLGMPDENDWILLSNWNDRSLIRNELAFHLARAMGQYAPRTHLCEVLVDSVYQGIYVFGEKIKRDSGRVDIAKLTGDENTGDDLTGGYILQQNLWLAENSFESNFSPIDHPGLDVHFIYEYPAPDTISDPQRTYIAAFVDSLETALYGTDWMDPVNGYRKYLDVPSFINYFLVNEVARNADGFKKSVFYHKDKNSNGGKFRAGPVWDFDWAWKNIFGCESSNATDGSGWTHLVNDCVTDNYSTGWYVRLLQDPSFANELRCTYNAQRQTALSDAQLFAYIDSTGTVVQNAQERHYRKWPMILGVSGPAPEVLAVATTYSAELDTLKNWISERLVWMDANLPGVCSGVGVQDLSAANAISCFPNPSSGNVHFSSASTGKGPWTLSIHDPTWRTLEQIRLPSGTFELDVELPGPGTYFYVVEQAGVMLYTGKVVVY